MLLLGAVLFVLYAWRSNFGMAPPLTSAVPLNPVFVEVSGKVPRPGVYSFAAPPTLLEIWRQAGGPKPPTDSKVRLPSGSRVEVIPAGEYRLGRMSGPSLLSLGLSLDLNTATAEDLEALPGVGPVLAQRIFKYRQVHGPFNHLEDLVSVPGVGKKKLAQLKPYLMVLSPPEASTP